MVDMSGQTTSPVMTALVQSGHQFSFPQVMRLARRFLDPCGKKGLPEIPWQERVQIRPKLSLAFPAADVARVERDGANLRVTTTFLELYGPASPLPNFYSEDLLDEASNDESVFRDFLDIIHQRLYHLYFQCWSKYRLFIRVVEENNPVDRERLFCLIGLGEKELRATLPDSWSLLRYTGILTQFPRSALGLATILRDALKEQRIRIIQNVKRMIPIPRDQRMRMGMSGCCLGVDTVLGSEIADRMGKFRIEIGPLTWAAYNDFLPGTSQNEKLGALVRFYLTDPLEVELKLILAAREAKPIRLGDPAARLGLNIWCFSGDTLGEVSAGFQVPALPFRQTLPSGPEPLLPSQESHRSMVDYYREERAHLRELTEHFVQKHPNLAPLMSGAMADPGMGRLLEGTAFYNAMLQRKLDDDIPEFIHEVTEALHPWDLRPIPATTIVAFTPKAELKNQLLIAAGAEVESVPVQGVKCRFRTCFDVTVHPLTLLNASFSQPSGKAPAIKLLCELHGIGLSGWKAESLRLFLADEYPAASDLYLLLQRYLKRICIGSCENGATIEILPGNLKPVGFADTDVLLTREAGLLPGHLQQQEYFLFPDKFLFLDLTGLNECRNLGNGSQFEINFELKNISLVVPQVNEKSFVLFATPVINLFKHKAEPLSFNSNLQQHIIRPVGEHSAHYQIHSVNSVEGLVKKKSTKIKYEVQNRLLRKNNEGPICHITRGRSAIGDGFDILLSVPGHGNEKKSNRIKLDIDLTCTNGILPEQLGIGDVRIAAMATPESIELRNIKCVSGMISQSCDQNRQWRLLSGFSLNSASLVSAKNLKAMLRLFINQNSRHQVAAGASDKRINAIESVESIPTDRLIGRTIYRGYEVHLKLRGDHFTSPGDLYLFSSVLERFLGGYVTKNCFVRLVVEEIDKGYRFKWSARMGDRCVL
ncbi:MAG: type VI secretion system baseplate subunit TssF [Geobacteraceae bacterium]|nr:type VI secretion system baseplate subunit TssF [Geobacteraceae bacterium]